MRVAESVFCAAGVASMGPPKKREPHVDAKVVELQHAATSLWWPFVSVCCAILVLEFPPQQQGQFQYIYVMQTGSFGRIHVLKRGNLAHA